jgi:hypothetical protein
MSIKDQLDSLECIRCGTRKNLTTESIKKTSLTGTKTFQVPACESCKEKFERYRKSMPDQRALGVALSLILFLLFSASVLFRALWFLTVPAMGILFIGHAIWFKNAWEDEDNPRRYMRYRNLKGPLVRPQDKGDWRPLAEWIESCAREAKEFTDSLHL